MTGFVPFNKNYYQYHIHFRLIGFPFNSKVVWSNATRKESSRSGEIHCKLFLHIYYGTFFVKIEDSLFLSLSSLEVLITLKLFGSICMPTSTLREK
jgi:hypothetical protein